MKKKVLIKKNRDFFFCMCLFKSRGSVLSFEKLHVQILIQNNILGAIHFS